MTDVGATLLCVVSVILVSLLVWSGKKERAKLKGQNDEFFRRLRGMSKQSLWDAVQTIERRKSE